MKTYCTSHARKREREVPEKEDQPRHTQSIETPQTTRLRHDEKFQKTQEERPERRYSRIAYVYMHIELEAKSKLTEHVKRKEIGSNNSSVGQKSLWRLTRASSFQNQNTRKTPVRPTEWLNSRELREHSRVL
jgi:hypothetical protein